MEGQRIQSWKLHAKVWMC